MLFPTKLDSLDSDFIYKSYSSSGLLFGSCSEMVRSLRSKGPNTLVLCFLLPNAFLWCGTGLGSGGTPEMDRSLRPKGPGISGPSFSQLVCIFVVRYWIGVRNTPGECPESPARPESPALWTGISGLPDDPAGRGLRSFTPESPAWTGSHG